jgi:hypothetical protein
MASYERSAGEPYPALVKGDTLTLTGEGRFAPVRIDALRCVTVRATGGARIIGDSHRNAERVGVLVRNSAGVRLEGLETSNWGRGFRAIGVEDLSLVRCCAHGNGIEGFQLNSIATLRLEDCLAEDNGLGGVAGYPDQGGRGIKGHGVYIANDSRRVTIRRLESRNNGGCGLQFNWDPERSPRNLLKAVDEVQVEDSRFLLLTAGAGAGINCASLSNARFWNCLVVVEVHDAGGVAFFVDGEDSTYACHDVVLDGMTILCRQGRFGMQLLHGAHQIAAKNSLIGCGRGLAVEGPGAALHNARAFEAAQFGEVLTLLNHDYTPREAALRIGWSPRPSPVQHPAAAGPVPAEVTSAVGSSTGPHGGEGSAAAVIPTPPEVTVITSTGPSPTPTPTGKEDPMGPIGGGMIANLLLKFIPQLAGTDPKAYVRQRMEAAIPHIVDTMQNHGKTPALVGPRIVVHRALYHLWDAMIPGEVADQIRDREDAKVWKQLEDKVSAQTSLHDAVTMTRDAAIELAF